MVGLYLHIPFCERKCNYCDFFSITGGFQQDEFCRTLLKEAEIRKGNLEGEVVDTVYLGGGTPTLLDVQLLDRILSGLRSVFNIRENAEVTIEANPDDLTDSLLDQLLKIGFNRISIGVQSFYDEHLRLMNRRHDAGQALRAIGMASEAGFENISIDLIYGIPGMSMDQWSSNLERLNDLPVVHLSAYHLTIEPGTVFGRMLQNGQLSEVSENESFSQYLLLGELASAAGFEQYEISNFARNGRISLHNSKYWSGESYLGLGPSAHSFYQTIRQWNPSNLQAWFELVEKDGQPATELLTPEMMRNEHVMTRLRTAAGISRMEYLSRFGEESWNELLVLANRHIGRGDLTWDGERLRFSREAWFRSDGIIADLFVQKEIP